MSVTPTLERLRQKDREIKTSTNYKTRLCPLPITQKKKKKKAQGCRDASVGKVIAAQTGELELRSPILGMWGRDT